MALPRWREAGLPGESLQASPRFAWDGQWLPLLRGKVKVPGLLNHRRAAHLSLHSAGISEPAACTSDSYLKE